MRAKRLLAVFAAFMMSAAVFAVGCGNGGGSGDEEPGGEQTQQYTVTFNLNGAPGTAPSSVKVDEGGKVSAPDDPPGRTTTLTAGTRKPRAAKSGISIRR